LHTCSQRTHYFNLPNYLYYKGLKYVLFAKLQLHNSLWSIMMMSLFSGMNVYLDLYACVFTMHCLCLSYLSDIIFGLFCTYNYFKSTTFLTCINNDTLNLLIKFLDYKPLFTSPYILQILENIIIFHISHVLCSKLVLPTLHRSDRSDRSLNKFEDLHLCGFVEWCDKQLPL